MKKIIYYLLPKILVDLYKWCSLNKEEKFIKKELKRIKKIKRFEIGYTTIFGLDTKIKFVDSASFQFIYNEIFNNNIYNFISKSKNPFIIDAGANIGLSVIYFKKLYPNSEIIAFEPDENVFTTLEYNINSLQINNVTLVKKALWNEVTELRFYSEGADGGRLANEGENNQIIKINTTLLSDYINNRIVDLLKIDIEGAELFVLQEARRYLKNVNNIFVEYHSFKNKPQKLAELLCILEEEGFRLIIHHIGTFSSQPFIKINEYNDMDLQLNIFGVR